MTPEEEAAARKQWFEEIPKLSYCRCFQCCCPAGTGHDTDAYRAWEAREPAE